MSVLKNLKLRGFKDILNPKRWKIFLNSKKREIVGTTFIMEPSTTPEEIKKNSVTIGNEEMQSFIEQVFYRQSFGECIGCWKNGSCTHCGCKAPELFYEKEMVCSGGNWNEVLPPAEWEEFKKQFGLKIVAVYGRN